MVIQPLIATGAAATASRRLSNNMSVQSKILTTTRAIFSTSMRGMVGGDSSMIAANHRWNHHLKHNNTSFTNFKTRNGGKSVRYMSSNDDISSMKDEYGEMTSCGSTYIHPTPFRLESGEIIPNATLRYQTYGELNDARDNVLVICHALTGNASLQSWWGELLGPNRAFDTNDYFVVCANILGSCYGSTSPMFENPDCEDGKVYGINFPDVSVQDSVRLQIELLKNELNITSVKSVIGGSFGGMQALEYAVQAGSTNSSGEEKKHGEPFLRSAIPIACGAYHTAWQLAISETQRQAIYADPKWRGGDVDIDDPPLSGLSVARQIGMVSYRSPTAYETKFGRRIRPTTTPSSSPPPTEPKYGQHAQWEVKSYLKYQGHKFLTRFDPITYVKLTEQMDSHDITRNRTHHDSSGVEEVLGNIHIPALVVGIDSDVLYPLYLQEQLVDALPNGRLGVVKSDAGHDGFLLEQEQVSRFIEQFLEELD